MAEHVSAGGSGDDDIEVPDRDRHEQRLPPPPDGREPASGDPEAPIADRLDQGTPVRGADEPGRVEPGDETDGGT